MADWFNSIDPNADIQDQLVKMNRNLEFFGYNLDHHNVKQLYTEYCDIQSEHGETIIDGPLVKMYSATDSTTLRLRMGYNSLEFVFELFDKSGDLTVSINSSGEAVFSGKIETGQNAFIGEQVRIGQTSSLPVSTASSDRRGIYFYQANSTILDAGSITLDDVGEMRITAPDVLALFSTQFQIVSQGQANIYIGSSSDAGAVFIAVPGDTVGSMKIPVQIVGSTNYSGIAFTVHENGVYAGDGTQSSDRLQTCTTWANYNAVLTWTGGTPHDSMHAYRFQKLGKLVLFQVFFQSTQIVGGPATGLTISLPVNGTTDFTQIFLAYEATASVYGIQTFAFGSSNNINFIPWTAWTTASKFNQIYVTGMYESSG